MSKTKITPQQIRRSFDVGVAVYFKEIDFNIARDLLVSEAGMVKNSASDYVRHVLVLLDGKPNKRKFSHLTAEIFLQLTAEKLPAHLGRAIQSLIDHVKHYEVNKPFRRNQRLLDLVSEWQFKVSEPKLPLSALQAQLDEKTAIALQLEPDELKRQAESAKGVPHAVSVTTTVFMRSAAVRAFTLMQANGKCAGCGKHAPFNRVDGTPFLEVHHRIPLAENGEDTIANTVALCPNCHREAHFGAEWQKFRAISP